MKIPFCKRCNKTQPCPRGGCENKDYELEELLDTVPKIVSAEPIVGVRLNLSDGEQIEVILFIFIFFVYFLYRI